MFATSKNGCQSWLRRIFFFVAAQTTTQRMYAFTSHGKCQWSDVTCESGHGFAKSIGYQRPSFRRASHELNSQSKKELIVSVTLRRCCSSSLLMKSVFVV